jgi:hypothetical protein
MGYFLDWVSVAGLGKDEVLLRLGLIDGGEPTDFPDRGGFMWTVTPEGRVIVVTGEYGLFEPAVLTELSAGASLVAGRAETNECTSTAWGYEGGRQTWMVAHDHEGPSSVQARGAIPPAFDAIRADLLKSRAAEGDVGSSLFEAPIELTATIGGWAPESITGSNLEFFTARRVREPAGKKSRPLRPPPMALALVGAHVVELAALTINGAGIYGSSPMGSFGFSAMGGAISVYFLWATRHGRDTLAILGLLLVSLLKAALVFKEISLGGSYLPLAVPVLLMLVGALLYEYGRTTKPNRRN